jgi:hypothetical protein
MHRRSDLLGRGGTKPFIDSARRIVLELYGTGADQ